MKINRDNSDNRYYYYTLLHQLALRSKWICRPNPAVAAVVVKNKRVISWGYTQPIGRRHAEYEALYKLGKRARGTALYVTLMPCCFHGKTPACTDIIISSGIQEVHVAGFDNDSRMLSHNKGSNINSQAVSILRKAGIRLYFDCPPVIAKKLFFLNWDYFKRNAIGLPTITIKYAMTLDGKIAGPTLHSSNNTGGDFRGKIKISGKDIEVETHNERAQHDAIMVGGNTLCNDNPRLSVRLGDTEFEHLKLGELLPRGETTNFRQKELAELQKRILPSQRKDNPFIGLLPRIIQPLPVILTRSAVPSNFYLMKKKNPRPLFLIPSSSKKFFPHQRKVIFQDSQLQKRKKVNQYWLRRDNTWTYQGWGSPQNPEFWEAMAKEFAISSIFLEGGATLQSYLWNTGLVDRVHVYVSPRLFRRGNDALSPFTELELPVNKKHKIKKDTQGLSELIGLWHPWITVWEQDIKISGFVDNPQNHLVKQLWEQLFPSSKSLR